MRTCLSDLPLKKHNQIIKSTSIPKFFISVESYEMNKEIGTAFYCIEIGFVHDDQCVSHYVTKRFSEIEKLDQILRKRYLLSDFPPKRFISKNDPSFLAKRANSLQEYFSKMSQIKDIINFTQFQDFFEICICE